MLQSTAFPVKDFGTFIKKNKADFSKLPHDLFKPWPSSGLCNTRVRADCQPLCTRHFNRTNTFPSEHVCTCSTSPSPAKGRKSTTLLQQKASKFVNVQNDSLTGRAVNKLNMPASSTHRKASRQLSKISSAQVQLLKLSTRPSEGNI